MNKQEIERAIGECKSVFNAVNCLFSAWESEFIDSVENQFLDRGSLSEKQSEILQRIWDKI